MKTLPPTLPAEAPALSSMDPLSFKELPVDNDNLPDSPASAFPLANETLPEKAFALAEATSTEPPTFVSLDPA